MKLGSTMAALFAIATVPPDGGWAQPVTTRRIKGTYNFYPKGSGRRTSPSSGALKMARRHAKKKGRGF